MLLLSFKECYHRDVWQALRAYPQLSKFRPICVCTAEQEEAGKGIKFTVAGWFQVTKEMISQQ
jgi:hypothetical protein